MKKNYFISIHLLVSMTLVMMIVLMISCKNDSQMGTDAQNQIDSLTILTQDQGDHIKEMELFITSLSQTIDSIDLQERELVVDGDIEKRSTQSRESIINNLNRFKETLERQKLQIEDLERQLSTQKGEMSSKMLQIVEYYKHQLEEKDKTIANLQKAILENKSNIRQLQASVTNLLTTNKEQNEIIKEQENTLTRQSGMINSCYVKIGTKKELKSAGLISTGLLKKTKVDESMFTPDKFVAMDMRNCNDIEIKSSNPKILTNMPSSSYSIVKNENGTCYLHIIDPSKFWSVSRYLVILL